MRVFKIERRSSGRLVNKRIILSEDEEGNGAEIERENVMDIANRELRTSTRSKKNDFLGKQMRRKYSLILFLLI